MKRLLTILILLMLVASDFCADAQELPPVFRIRKMSFSDGFYSDISPVIVKDGVIFCSDRRFSAFKDKKTFEGKRLYNLYFAEMKDTSTWLRPQEITSERSSVFNNGPLCVGPDGKTVYFTSDVETGKITLKKSYQNHSGIFIADRSGNDLVSIRPFPFNSILYNVGHPSVSADGRFLYFASDMPGGQGGSDIYRSELVNGQWTKPENLGPKINSSSAENYPYIHSSGRLYFSSDRPGGFGKMDVYFTMFSAGKWDDPTPMMKPVNSEFDDFAFVADENLQTGYFTSDRERNDDIYSFTSTIIRKSSCDTLSENNYCFEFFEENAVKWDTIPFRYEWKFGDGSKATGSLVDHCYPGPGNYLVQLDVVNLITKEVKYNEKSYSLNIQEIEQPYITCQDKGQTGELIRFSADQTNLPGWNIVRYYWNFGDETIAVGKDVDKKFLKPGTYNVQLIVTTGAEPGGMAREACICKNIVITGQP